MKKIKIFGSSEMAFGHPNPEKVERKVNAFLEADGKTIKVIDVQYQVYGTLLSVLVFYDELGGKA